MHHIIAETPRLVIREYIAADAPALAMMNDDPRVLQYAKRQPYNNVAEAELYTQTYKTMYDDYGFGRWAVVTREDGQCIGYCGIKFRPDKNLIDLGYRFLPSHWGKGYATEAAKACVEYAFNKLRLPRIWLSAAPENAASRHVAEKIGFQIADVRIDEGLPWQFYYLDHPDPTVADLYKPVLETDRLVMRRMMECDYRVMYALNDDPEVMRYVGDGPFETPEHSYDFLFNYQDVYRKYGFARWTVELKATGQRLGWCGLRLYREDGDMDLGYRFFRKHWNKGYATEASLACIKYAFETLGFDYLTARANVENVGSYRVMEKCGMKRLREEPYEGMGMTYLYDLRKP